MRNNAQILFSNKVLIFFSEVFFCMIEKDIKNTHISIKLN